VDSSYDYAEAHFLLRNTKAGFRNQRDTIHQLQNVIMSLKVAKCFKQDIFALIVDFTSAFKYHRPRTNALDYEQSRLPDREQRCSQCAFFIRGGVLCSSDKGR